ncbi:MAG TPA: manganese efflux pump MntP family protein [Patescibacteria group bacterium]|nr:manganese efflux pump MntP family protein [Patescibacteria group bacterium]
MGSWLQILVIAVSLALDSVSVSIASGLEIDRARYKHALRVGIFFGGFQALMPLLGWVIGNSLKSIVTVLAPWIAFILLVGIGWLMLKEARSPRKEKIRSILSTKTLFLLAIATSIDAFLVGISLGLVTLPLILSVSIIGIVTFALCVIAFLFASSVSTLFRGKLDMLGGIVLIALGLKILLSAYL